MRYIIFTRVSTDKQEVANQLKECLEYVEKAKKPNDQLIQFEEKATSTRLSPEDRPILQEMLRTIRKDDTLVIYKLDRLARRGAELIKIYDDFMKLGVKVISINEPYINELLIHVYAMVALSERDNVRIRTISALERKKAALERVGTTWYGYRLDETELNTRKGAKSEGKPYKLLKDPEEQACLSLMVEMYNRGRSYQQIANELEASGYRNRKGRPFQKASIHRILKRQPVDQVQEELAPLASH